MGILTQTRCPIAAGPVVLITDTTFMTPSNISAAHFSSSEVLVPDTFAVVLDSGVPCPVSGSEAVTFHCPNGRPDVWTCGQFFYPLGQVVDTQRDQISQVCGALGNGLRGIVLGQPTGTNFVLIRVVKK